MKNFNKGKFLTSLTIVSLLAIVVGVIYVTATNEIEKYKKNWDVIQFAMQEPDLVRTFANQYETEKAEFKNSYMKKELTPAEKVVETINQKLEGTSK